MQFIPPREDFRLKDMADFVMEHNPKTIEMTLKEEFWYRQLLNPEAMLPHLLTFHGIPVIVIDVN